MRRVFPLILFLLPAAMSPAIAQAPDSVLEKKILADIRARAKAHYDAYRGVRGRRVAVTREIDPATKKLKREIKAVTSHLTYYKRPPVIKVISCTENGKPAKPAKCRAKKPPKPMWPVFGSRGREHYSLRVVGAAKIRGETCWKIKVTPRARTARHFRGHMYFTQKGLRLKEMRGRPANLKFGLKSMRTSIRFGALQGAPVIKSGSVHLRVKVPLVYNAVIKVFFTESGHRLIAR